MWGKKKKKFRFKRKRTIRGLFLSFIKNSLILGIAIGFFGVGAFLFWSSSLKIPNFTSIDDRKMTESTKIYDRTGEVLLYDIHEEVKRTDLDFNDISRNLRNATVAIEDAEFYNHFGIRPISFMRAVIANITTGSLGQGGSTITQQVVKNTLLTPEKKISRKLKEWILAVKLEQALEKEEILTLYLNESPYGGNLYGAEEASLTFFEKSAKDLTLAESAYIAALPQAPTFFSPYGNNTKDLENRKNLVLSRMLDLSFITEDEYIEAINEDVIFQPRASHGMKAPHFVAWVREELVTIFGERAVNENGYRVITTLDYELQEQAEEIVSRYGEENVTKFNAHNAGMIGITPKTGDVLVMVGSRDYFDTENEGNFNVTLAQRQPGSSFKPFVYATAFQKGYTPDTVVFDVKTQFQTTCDAYGEPLTSENDPDECYTPKNYDNVYRGPVSLRDALAQSINVPAIKALYLAGLKDSLQTAKDLGVTSLTNTDQYGLTLVLGGGEASLLEMTNAYGIFANEGIRNDYQNILRVEDSEGKIVWQPTKYSKRVIDKEVTDQISDILSDNEARTPAFGARSFLYFDDYDVAVKTGTTNDYRDAWIIGYTPSFALGTWVGNNDNSSMEKKVAGFIVAPMWHEMMETALDEYDDGNFFAWDPQYTQKIKPILRGVWKGNSSYYVDSISGNLATEHTPMSTREERFVTDVHSILHWVNKKDPNGPIPSNPSSDYQYELWETPVHDWAIKNNYIGGSTKIPTQLDSIHTVDTKPQITINTPRVNQTIKASTPTTITITNKSIYPLDRVDFFINNIYIGSTKNKPYSFTFTPSKIDSIRSSNTLKVVASDLIKNVTASEVVFNVVE